MNKDTAITTDTAKISKISIRRAAAEGILPLLEMVGIMILTIFLFRLTRACDGTFVQPSSSVGGDETDPSRGRLIYMFMALVLGGFFMVSSSVLSRKSERSHSAWLCACAGGVLLWQSLGESMWHFGFNTETGFTNFPRLECAQGWVMMIPFTLILMYAIIKNEMTFGLRATLGVFWANWIGHIVMIGTYPLAASRFDEVQWYPLICLIVGIPLVMLSLAGIFLKRTDWYMKHYSALLFFASYGMIVYGAILREV